MVAHRSQLVLGLPNQPQGPVVPAAAAVDDSVLAPVLSQPSLPIGLTAKQKAAATR